MLRSGSVTVIAPRRILDGPLAWEIARFGAPLALGMALQNAFNLVDAYLVAQLPHAEAGPAIGALGICDQLAAVGTIVSYGVATATGALLSNRKGAGDAAIAGLTLTQSDGSSAWRGRRAPSSC